MRTLAALLAAVLLIPAAAAAQPEFVQAYQAGERAFKSGNYALAEQKFREARDHRRAPKQGRKVNLSGNFREPFIPDFYLGVIAERQRDYKQADALLTAALNAGLVTEDDRENYALATKSLQVARDGLARLAANTRPPPVETKPPVTTTATNPPTTQPSSGQTSTGTNTQPPATTVTPPPVRITPPVNPPVNPPPTNVEPAWMAGFRRSMDAARASLRQNRYAEARSSLAAAAGAAGDTASRQQAEQLRREIDSALNVEAQRIAGLARTAIRQKNLEGALTQVAALETLAPGHASLAELRTGVEGLRGALKGDADLARIERVGVRLFLSGNYKESGDELERAVGAGVTSPRIFLFLASSRAAQALLAPQDERPALVEEARRTYARAKPEAGALQTDERFISPSILKLLNGG